MNWKALIPWLISAALLAFLLFRGNDGLIAVKVPSVSGNFRAIQPTPLKVEPAPLPVIKQFEEAKPEAKLKLYKKAVAKRTYKRVFEDSIQKITVTARTTGTLDSLALEYKTKERIIELPYRSKAHLYIGGEVSMRPTGAAYMAKAYVTAGKVMFSAGYDFQVKGVFAGAALKIF